jgi:hypothetical protein
MRPQRSVAALPAKTVECRRARLGDGIPFIAAPDADAVGDDQQQGAGGRLDPARFPQLQFHL